MTEKMARMVPTVAQPPVVDVEAARQAIKELNELFGYVTISDEGKKAEKLERELGLVEEGRARTEEGIARKKKSKKKAKALGEHKIKISQETIARHAKLATPAKPPGIGRAPPPRGMPIYPPSRKPLPPIFPPPPPGAILHPRFPRVPVSGPPAHLRGTPPRGPRPFGRLPTPVPGYPVGPGGLPALPMYASAPPGAIPVNFPPGQFGTPPFNPMGPSPHQQRQLFDDEQWIHVPPPMSQQQKILADSKAFAIRLLLDIKHCAKVAQGVQQIMTDTDTQVEVLESTRANSVQVGRIFGPRIQLRKICDACKMVTEIIAVAAAEDVQTHGGDFKTTFRHGNYCIVMLVDENNVWPILGERGSGVSRTRAATGATIQVGTEPLADSSERTCLIAGTQSQVFMAINIILKQVCEFPDRVDPLYPFQPQPEYPLIGDNTDPFNMPSRVIIPIPTTKMHVVAARQFEGLRLIEHRSGASLELTHQQERGQACIVRGKAEQVQMAVEGLLKLTVN